MPNNDQTVAVTVNDLYSMLMYSTRYALGRSSYAPGQVMGWLRDYQDDLLTEALVTVARDIREEVDRWHGTPLVRIPYEREWLACAEMLDRTVGERGEP